MGTSDKRKALKRPHNLDKIDRSQHLKRVRNATNKRDKSSSSCSSGRSYERSSESDISEELVTYKEPSMYDNLLSVLGHCCESFPELYETQRDREVERDLWEEEGSSAESSRLSEGESDGNSVEVCGD
ncbi:protein NUCLEOLAR FACTOR 1-like [Aristolochia californica]|uniref:protein NUCLEOLAR FACTOR 1-like n=1 Tax=Aristolochia californica TaxID=171875 RepID=UPI0035E1931C